MASIMYANCNCRDTRPITAWRAPGGVERVLRRVRVLVLLEFDSADPAVVADEDAGRHGLLDDADVSGLRRRGQGFAGVVFRLNRTERHAGIVALAAAALVGLM